MDAGRELDALVAEKIMGLGNQWTRKQQEDGTFAPTGQVWFECPHYSTDIAAAWQMEKEISIQNELTQRWYVWHLADQIGHPWHEAWTSLDMFLFLRATPEQRCIAALKACGVEL